VRIALLEKGVPFEEDLELRACQEDEFLARTPMGKVPFLELDARRSRIAGDLRVPRGDLSARVAVSRRPAGAAK